MKVASKGGKLVHFLIAIMLIFMAHQSFAQKPQKQPTPNEDQSKQIRYLIDTLNTSTKKNTESLESLKRDVNTLHDAVIKFSELVGKLNANFENFDKNISNFWKSLTIITSIFGILIAIFLGFGYTISILNLKRQFEKFSQNFNQNLDLQFEKFGLKFRSPSESIRKSPFPPKRRRFDGFPSSPEIKKEGKEILSNSD